MFKDRPLDGHALARPAHEAARCAGATGLYWAYHDRLFAEQPGFERARLVRYAADLGLDRAEFTRCLDERRHAAAVEADLAQARALGVTSTPTFLINGRAVVGAISVDDFRWLIDEALGRGRR
ncbi:MAG TPA: hypothetical protein DCQ64_29345 [Candidatus Rokubacteria bacterium]|nr:hypothetical protein [Candidatus Rokubacteria bacterium]